jgi:hypothetical protein
MLPTSPKDALTGPRNRAHVDTRLRLQAGRAHR